MSQPYFENTGGYHAEILIGQYDSWVPILRRQLYDFSLDAIAPLTFVGPDGRRSQPDRVIKRMDFGSVPRPLQPIPGFRSLSYPRATSFHDSDYRYHGRFFWDPVINSFKFLPVTREEADDFLYQQMEAEALLDTKLMSLWTHTTKHAYHVALHLAGGYAWKHQYDPKLRIRYGFAVGD